MPNTPKDPRFAEVQDVIERYFDGLYRGDRGALATIFHAKASYFTASSGELLHLDMPTYLPIVAARSSPESKGEPRSLTVDSIEFAGPVSAFVRLRCSLLGRDFGGATWRL